MEEMTIGQRIAACRKELNLSQMGLGEKVGVTRQAISKWEADAAIPEIDKLIALSRLFGVSVDWLLGVVDGNGSFDPRDEEEEKPEEAFTARERELIAALTKPRPAPRWQKFVMAAVAVCVVLALAVSCFALYRTTKFQEDLNVSVQTVMELFAPGISSAANQLEEYSFTLFPYEDLRGADVELRAVPMFYEEGMKARLTVTLGGEEVEVRDCDWDGSAFSTDFAAKAANGYEVTLSLTDADGVSFTRYLTDPVLMNLGNSLRFGATEVHIDGFRLDREKTLHLENIHFLIELPPAWRDVVDKWTRCDLVVYAGGKEADRVDILNRSQYSKQIDFSDTTADFTSGTQAFDLSSAEEGQRIHLMLECEFCNGQTMSTNVREWVLTGTKLVAG